MARKNGQDRRLAQTLPSKSAPASGVDFPPVATYAHTVAKTSAAD
jgi:hypothetical protein